MNDSQIHNCNGDKLPTRSGQFARTNLTSVCIEGVDIDVHYEADGCYMPATDVDAAEYPVCIVKKLEIGGVDVTRLFHDSSIEETIAEKVEASWRD